ncbi:MAG TPA: metallophosphoesterase [Longimicrobium sp.]|nr:metallophosphoesterase [Longimicrobium sp.]
MNRRRFLITGASALAAGAAGVVGYTLGIEPHWVEVVERAMPVRGLPGALDGRRMVQVSDLHVGPRVDDGYLVRSLASLAALRPDVVVITGDLISYVPYDFDAQLLRLRRVLAALPKPPLGTFATLGNHDYGINWAQPEVAARVAEELERAGVRVLRNEAADVGGLRIVGLDDLWGQRFAPALVLPGLPAGAPAVALSHNPDTVDLDGWEGFGGWILAGHTHGGQCKPPFLPPPLLPIKNRRYAAGEIALSGGRTLYVNRGLGHLIQARFNVRPEITVFTLRPA